MTKNDLKNFCVAGIMGFDTYDYEKKAKWHTLGKKVAREIAKRLELPKGSFDVRSNMGGPAVSGEITLHSNYLYVQFSISCLGPSFGFMYRACNGRKDYTGGRNRWMRFDVLMDEFDSAVDEFRNVMGCSATECKYPPRF